MGEFDWPKVGEFEVAIGALSLTLSARTEAPRKVRVELVFGDSRREQV
jgi:hypothetical protein